MYSIRPWDTLRQLLVRAGLFRRNASGGPSELRGEEFKLPKMASLVVVIVYNMMLQVRSYTLLVHGSMA